MDGGSVNVESRTSAQDKRWTIMAARLGTNTAFMSFQAIEQETNPNFIRYITLPNIPATLHIQVIYFFNFTYMITD